ncbi:MAG: hypothetical protein ACJAZ0_001380 [Halioglobus sp.]|jgi:hypothetical protein
MRFSVFIAFILISNLGIGKTVGELERSGQLQISSSLLPLENIVAGQKIEMAIDIATDRWFAGGTRLRLPEVAGLVILQTNDFASNSTEQRQGQTWVIQRWTLDVYPQRSGTFSIPPVSATVEVNDESDGVVAGTLYSPAVRFEASLPADLDSTQHWVASPTFSVTQRFDKELDALQPGDAILREVVFEATEVMAMMLPSLDTEKGAGLVAYPQPPVLTNSSNRGTTTAKRVDSITYIAESAGQYHLPAQSYYWWDTQTQELRIRLLPKVEIVVGPGSLSQIEEKDTSAATPLNFIPLLYGALLISLAFGAVWLCFRIIRSPQLARFGAAVKTGWTHLRALTQPALPAALNPDNSAEE